MGMRKFAAWSGALLLVVGLSASASAQGKPAPGTPGGRPGGSPTQPAGGGLTPAEKAHVKELIKEGRAGGKTHAQIRAEVDAYLKSIGKSIGGHG